MNLAGPNNGMYIHLSWNDFSPSAKLVSDS
jgi:hypothetical protein